MTLRAGPVPSSCAAFLAFSLTVACSPRPSSSSSDAGADTPPWGTATAAPEARAGMVWIPPGPLVAGTPYGKTPRVPDEEMAGEQIVMHGFHIDLFPFPNEPGALPQTSVTQAEALAACASQNKRLCTELEIERACKGPQNTTYEYGDVYRAQVCGTGNGRAPGPNGMNHACASGFGVSDLHGGAWTWTASPWKRDPAKPGLVAIRGGNGPLGDVVGRCANGRGVKPDVKLTDLGFRCCAGDPNPYEVTIEVARGEPLTLKPPENKVAPALELLAKSTPDGPKAGRFTVERIWIWRPFGNEEVWVGGGCSETIKSKSGKKRRGGCGLMLARATAGARGPDAAHAAPEAPIDLGFVPTDRWQPTLSLGDSTRDVLLYGGDEHGPFRRKLVYDWGKVTLGPIARKKPGKGDIYE